MVIALNKLFRVILRMIELCPAEYGGGGKRCGRAGTAYRCRDAGGGGARTRAYARGAEAGHGGGGARRGCRRRRRCRHN